LDRGIVNFVKSNLEGYENVNIKVILSGSSTL